jgi:hypothetical protein
MGAHLRQGRDADHRLAGPAWQYQRPVASGGRSVCPPGLDGFGLVRAKLTGEPECERLPIRVAGFVRCRPSEADQSLLDRSPISYADRVPVPVQTGADEIGEGPVANDLFQDRRLVGRQGQSSGVEVTHDA